MIFTRLTYIFIWSALFFSTIACVNHKSDNNDTHEQELEEEAILNSLLSYVGTEVTPKEEISGITLSDFEKDILLKENELAFNNLLEIYKSNKESVVYSPLSLYYLLGMAYSGSSGNTLVQFCDFTGFSKHHAETNGFFKKLLQGLRALDLSVSLSASNIIAINNKAIYVVSEDYKKNLANNYEAIVADFDFSQNVLLAKVLNAWTSKHTNGLIDNLFDKTSFSKNQLLMLVNALFIKGQWNPGFLDNLTKTDSFTRDDGTIIPLYFMNDNEKRLYGKTNNYSLLTLNVGRKNNHFGFTIILPNKDRNVSETLSLLRDKNWKEQLSICKEENVRISIPKFSIKGSNYLKDYLVKKGITDAFDQKHADFSLITSGKKSVFFLNNIIQKNQISIDEKGIEAASATAIHYTYGIDPKEINVEFMANRPFIYVISDLDSGIILFSGVFAGEA